MNTPNPTPTSTPPPPFHQRSTNERGLPPSSESIAKTNKKKLTWGLICLLGPTLLFVVTILAYAFVNLLTASTTQSSSELFTTHPIESALNILMFLVGAFVILTWLPGIVVGIILLATRRKLPSRQQ